MKRTIAYVVIGLISSIINAMIDVVPVAKYPLKLKVCTFELETIQFENQDINDLLHENIDAEELKLLKAEFCKKTITKPNINL